MNGYQEWHETAEGHVPMKLVMELMQKIKKLERRIDELSRSCEAEEWF